MNFRTPLLAAVAPAAGAVPMATTATAASEPPPEVEAAIEASFRAALDVAYPPVGDLSTFTACDVDLVNGDLLDPATGVGCFAQVWPADMAWPILLKGVTDERIGHDPANWTWRFLEAGPFGPFRDTAQPVLGQTLDVSDIVCEEPWPGGPGAFHDLKLDCGDFELICGAQLGNGRLACDTR